MRLKYCKSKNSFPLFLLFDSEYLEEQISEIKNFSWFKINRDYRQRCDEFITKISITTHKSLT